jgi:hypothetical protein
LLFAGIPQCIRRDQELVEEEDKDDDPAEDKDDPDNIALLDLNDQQKRKLAVIQRSMRDARPDRVLRLAPDDEKDIVQIVNAHVDNGSLEGENQDGLAVMAARMAVHCAFKPPMMYARFLQGLIWKASKEKANRDGFRFSQKGLILHVKEVAWAQVPPRTIRMSQGELSKLWMLCDFITDKHLHKWLWCMDQKWTVVRCWSSMLLKRAADWLQAKHPAQYAVLAGEEENKSAERELNEAEPDGTGSQMEESDVDRQSQNSRKRNILEPVAARSSRQRLQLLSQSSSGSSQGSSSSNDSSDLAQNAASSLLQAGQSLSQVSHASSNSSGSSQGSSSSDDSSDLSQTAATSVLGASPSLSQASQASSNS